MVNQKRRYCLLIYYSVLMHAGPSLFMQTVNFLCAFSPTDITYSFEYIPNPLEEISITPNPNKKQTISV